MRSKLSGLSGFERMKEAFICYDLLSKKDGQTNAYASIQFGEQTSSSPAASKTAPVAGSDQSRGGEAQKKNDGPLNGPCGCSSGGAQMFISYTALGIQSSLLTKGDVLCRCQEGPITC